jgi:hypothetical protein
MKLAALILIAAILVILVMRRPITKTIPKCPKGYYYAPWASAGTQCLPIGGSSSDAGISTDATRPELYSPKISPAWQENAVFYDHLNN